ncbi:MAG: pantoate--beta-alanine ligase, partial [Flavobacteriaceae bacterium]|nr:pantoate--beta-alanine ligase [Flavobacteriaceae bacterium]
KDFQQLQIIKKMVEKTLLPVSIIKCPIYREENGLAMSSRSEQLSKQQRNEASIIYSSLKTVREKAKTYSVKKLTQEVVSLFKEHPLFELEYFTIAEESTLKNTSEITPNKNYRAFIAVYAGPVRLIDTISLND